MLENTHWMQKKKKKKAVKEEQKNKKDTRDIENRKENDRHKFNYINNIEWERIKQSNPKAEIARNSWLKKRIIQMCAVYRRHTLGSKDTNRLEAKRWEKTSKRPQESWSAYANIRQNRMKKLLEKNRHIKC